MTPTNQLPGRIHRSGRSPVPMVIVEAQGDEDIYFRLSQKNANRRTVMTISDALEMAIEQGYYTGNENDCPQHFYMCLAVQRIADDKGITQELADEVKLEINARLQGSNTLNHFLFMKNDEPFPTTERRIEFWRDFIKELRAAE